MAEKEKCVVVGKYIDVEHFLVRCDEFQWEREKLLERISEAVRVLVVAAI